MNEVIAANIKGHLKAEGRKQGHLAKRIGMSNATMSLILQGKRRILAAEYIAICMALDKPLDFFLPDELHCTCAVPA